MAGSDPGAARKASGHEQAGHGGALRRPAPSHLTVSLAAGIRVRPFTYPGPLNYAVRGRAMPPLSGRHRASGTARSTTCTSTLQTPLADGDDRTGWTDQALRRHGRRRSRELHDRTRQRHRVPRSQRRRQDDDAADAAGPRRADRRHRHDRRPRLPRPAAPAAHGRRGARILQPIPGPDRPPAPPNRGSRRGRAGPAHPGDAPTRRSRRRHEPARRHVLTRDAPATRARHRAAVRPPDPDPRRTDKRARPRRGSAGYGECSAISPSRDAPS